MNLSDLEAKKIAIWGLGEEGMASYRFLRAHFPEKMLILINRDDPGNWPDGNWPDGNWPDDNHTHFILEDDLKEQHITMDVVIKSPGISLYHPLVTYFKERNVTVTSGTNIWFAQPRRGKVIAITGSNGKSTTCALLNHILNEHISNGSERTALLGGNIGRPLLSLPQDAEFYIVELSSYQTADLCYAPDIAVLLNLFPEHIQWHQTHTQYFADKGNLLRTGADTIILNHTDPLTKKEIAPIQKARWFNDPAAIHTDHDHILSGHKILGALKDITLPGKHNHENICAALTVCDILHLDLTECFKLAATYQGLPHRLENLGCITARTYINDSISTTPEATIAALKCFEGQAITLLIGGQDRQQDFTSFAVYIKNHPEISIIAAYETRPKICLALKAHGVSSYVTQASDLKDAVSRAQNITPKNGIILLSPAAPSYDGFTNFEQRGEAFKLFSRNSRT